MFLIIYLLCISLLCPSFSYLTLPMIKVINEESKQKVEEPEVKPPVPTEAPVEEETGRKITLNNTLDLDGYCTIRIPSSYYTLLDESTFTKKVIRYKDKKSKIIMSYVTQISEDADIPGYIVREAAQLDIVTNSKHEVEYDSGTWMVVPAEKVIDGSYPTVYYITSKDETSAFWMRVNMNENLSESDTEEFNEVVDTIINSYIMYYRAGTVFDTPTTGFYAENPVDGEDTIADTNQYRENSEDNNVFNTGKQGFDETADIAYTWSSLEAILDGQKIKLPCTLEDITNAGFLPNDSSKVNEKFFLNPGESRDMQFTNGNGTNVKFTFLNDSNTDIQEMTDCPVIKLDIDTSKFMTIKQDSEGSPDSEGSEGETSESSESTAEESSEESSSEESSESSEGETSENTEGESEEDDLLPGDAANLGQEEEPEKTFDDVVANHVVILPCGMMTNVYTTDILAYYGEATETSYGDGVITYTWKKDGKYLKLECGLVKNIQHITMSTMDGK